MINPVEYNFEIYQGQTLKYPFTVWDDNAQTIPHDFTDHSVKCESRLSYNATTSINLNATIEGNTVYLNATPDQLQKFIVRPGSSSSKYYYDIEVTLPDTTKWTMVRGIIEIFPEVTKI